MQKSHCLVYENLGIICCSCQLVLKFPVQTKVVLGFHQMKITNTVFSVGFTKLKIKNVIFVWQIDGS